MAQQQESKTSKDEIDFSSVSTWIDGSVILLSGAILLLILDFIWKGNPAYIASLHLSIVALALSILFVNISLTAARKYYEQERRDKGGRF